MPFSKGLCETETKRTLLQRTTFVLSLLLCRKDPSIHKNYTTRSPSPILFFPRFLSSSRLPRIQDRRCASPLPDRLDRHRGYLRDLSSVGSSSPEPAKWYASITLSPRLWQESASICLLNPIPLAQAPSDPHYSMTSIIGFGSTLWGTFFFL